MQKYRGNHAWRILVAIAACAAMLALVAPVASAAFGVAEFDLGLENEDGTAANQAAGHPYSVATDISFNTILGPGGEPLPDESVKTVEAEMPPGFVGSTTAVPRCTNSDLVGPTGLEAICPYASQVGMLDLLVSSAGGVSTFFAPIYNMVPPPGVPASFGINIKGKVIYLIAEIRTGSDYGVTVKARDTNQTLPILSATTTLWGVPADPLHDVQRCYRPSEASGFCDPEGVEDRQRPHSAGIPPKPLLTNVGNCGSGPFAVNGRADSWAHPGAFVPISATLEEAGEPVEIEGCEKVPFTPTMTVTPESREAGVPTGLEVELAIPGGGLENPKGVAQAALKDTTFVFPAGMTVNPSSADGLQGCSPAEAALGSSGASNCPAASKLGTVAVETPLLPTPLEGSVYLATQGSNPFGSLLAIYVSVEDARTGVIIKMPGKISPDPATGRLTATVQNIPQLPFSRFKLNLKGGNRAALVTPSACGAYATTGELAGWANPNQSVSLSSSFTIDQGCGKSGQFTPGFEAGTTNPVGGKFSPFTMRVTRPDGQQNVASLQTTLPKGLLAKLGGVALCPDNLAATGACPAASKVGSATVGAGSGTNPIYVPEPGKAPTAVYLAGPYKGAPYSLVAMVPAQAGPFDLGTVAVRNTIDVDPVSVQASVQSDPLPQILQGIPVSYRDIRVDMDRPEFTVNPTSCDPMAVSGQIGSAGGALATVSDRFQVGSCERLGFKPKLAMRFLGKTNRGAHPRLKVTVTMPKSGANIAKAVVLMPKTELLENAHIRTICTRDQWAADNCPKGSIYGKAKAWTPLLDKPLEGNVYLRSNGGARELPDLVADLKGQIDIELVGYIDAVNARLRARFVNVPDAPVSKFTLDMQGGKKGLLAHNTDVCRTKPVATAKLDGQNGKVHDFNPVVKVACGKQK